MEKETMNLSNYTMITYIESKFLICLCRVELARIEYYHSFNYIDTISYLVS